MPKDPIIANRDCLTEIAILQEIAGRMTLQGFRNDPIARRAAAYAIQTISEAVRRIPDEWLADFAAQPWAQIRASAIDCAMNTSGSTMPSCGRFSPSMRPAFNW